MPSLVLLCCCCCCCCCEVTSVVSDSVWPHRRQPTRLLCPWDSPSKNTGVGCHFLLQCMKVKSESEVTQLCPTLSDPITAACQAPLSVGFSRLEYWSGVPLPSPFSYVVSSKTLFLNVGLPSSAFPSFCIVLHASVTSASGYHPAFFHQVWPTTGNKQSW